MNFVKKILTFMKYGEENSHPLGVLDELAHQPIIHQYQKIVKYFSKVSFYIVVRSCILPLSIPRITVWVSKAPLNPLSNTGTK